VRGQVRDVVLDLAVNSASERGLLGIALHPEFAKNGWVYLFWSERRSGTDSTDLADVRLMSNRIDRFDFNGGELEFDRNVITFRSLQDDATNGVLRGSHNGGVIRFGPDGKLYAIVGDTGRRGQTQKSESLLFGRNFGVGTDVQTGPDGHIYVVSLSHGTVYEIAPADD
jgi:aldose sugar dehydrogenase